MRFRQDVRPLKVGGGVQIGAPVGTPLAVHKDVLAQVQVLAARQQLLHLCSSHPQSFSKRMQGSAVVIQCDLLFKFCREASGSDCSHCWSALTRKYSMLGMLSQLLTFRVMRRAARRSKFGTCFLQEVQVLVQGLRTAPLLVSLLREAQRQHVASVHLSGPEAGHTRERTCSLHCTAGAGARPWAQCALCGTGPGLPGMTPLIQSATGASLAPLHAWPLQHWIKCVTHFSCAACFQWLVSLHVPSAPGKKGTGRWV